MTSATSDERRRLKSVVPAPVTVEPGPGAYEIDDETEIGYRGSGAKPAATYLADVLRPSTGYQLPVVDTDAVEPAETILLSLADAPVDIDGDGYHLTVTADGPRLQADRPAGLFSGVATLRQLLPPAVERRTVQSGPWRIPHGTVVDCPRFPYRGAQLDVARHFFTVAEVRRFVDLISLYKLSHLHLHLTDDQGWRIEIDAWPRLTSHGARTNIGGGEGGFYTKSDYVEIVDYAASRGITVVPEIDVPAHTGAAVASYPELGGLDTAPELPVESGGTLAVDEERTYEFVTDVVHEIAALTPGPYFHVGGDEADDLTEAEYTRFIERVLPIVEEYGKRAIGWQEIVTADPPNSTVVQYWKDTDPDLAGYEVILSPNDHAYLNFRYDEETPLDGPETWGRRITSVRESYSWDPGTHVEGVDESSVLGVEFELWSENLYTFDDVEFMALPRLAGIAELGWSPSSKVGWESYERRLAAQADRWNALGMNYYRSPDVSWSS